MSTPPGAFPTAPGHPTPPPPPVPQPVYPVTPPDSGGLTTGGNFGATTLNVNLVPGTDLYIGGSSVTPHTYTLVPKTGTATSPTRFVPAGGDTIVKGAQYKSVTIDAADSLVLWEQGPEGVFDPIVLGPGLAGGGGISVPQTSGGSIGVALTGATPDDSQNTGPTSVPQHAEEVLQAGSNTIAPRHWIYSRMSIGIPTPTTAADVLNYIALKGHTSGVYYHLAFAGQFAGGTPAQQQVNSAEKLDIVAAVADTTAKGVWASWWAVGST